ncbi:hypothetical protein [Dialister sp.]|uniref:hypothetical protein n=1 Tax=Dialister sp. TaxID=1955814 RepID=UPI003F00EFFE
MSGKEKALHKVPIEGKMVEFTRAKEPEDETKTDTAFDHLRRNTPIDLRFLH